LDRHYYNSNKKTPLDDFLNAELDIWKSKLPKYIDDSTWYEWRIGIHESCFELRDGEIDPMSTPEDGTFYIEGTQYQKSTIEDFLEEEKLRFITTTRYKEKDWDIVNEAFISTFKKYLEWEDDKLGWANSMALDNWLELKHKEALLKLPKTTGRKRDSLQLNQFQWIPEDKSKIDEFYDKLSNCMDSNTTLERFREAFTPYKSKTSTTPINWLYSLRELRYFIDKYLIVDKQNPKLISKKNINIIIASQFTNKGEEITPKQISDAARWQHEAHSYPVIDLLIK